MKLSVQNIVEFTPQRLATYSLRRIVFSLTLRIEKLLLSLHKLEECNLSPNTHKHQSMARVYLTAAILEIEKMSLAERR